MSLHQDVDGTVYKEPWPDRPNRYTDLDDRRYVPIPLRRTYGYWKDDDLPEPDHVISRN